MRVSTDTLLGLRVRTDSGAVLGKVHAVVLDIDFNCIVQYDVRPKGIMDELLRRRGYRIAPSQVKSISKIEMIVEDAVLTETELARVRKAVPRRGVA